LSFVAVYPGYEPVYTVGTKYEEAWSETLYGSESAPVLPQIPVASAVAVAGGIVSTVASVLKTVAVFASTVYGAVTSVARSVAGIVGAIANAVASTGKDRVVVSDSGARYGVGKKIESVLAYIGATVHGIVKGIASAAGYAGVVAKKYATAFTGKAGVTGTVIAGAVKSVLDTVRTAGLHIAGTVKKIGEVFGVAGSKLVFLVVTGRESIGLSEAVKNGVAAVCSRILGVTGRIGNAVATVLVDSGGLTEYFSAFRLYVEVLVEKIVVGTSALYGIVKGVFEKLVYYVITGTRHTVLFEDIVYGAGMIAVYVAETIKDIVKTAGREFLDALAVFDIAVRVVARTVDAVTSVLLEDIVATGRIVKTAVRKIIDTVEVVVGKIMNSVGSVHCAFTGFADAIVTNKWIYRLFVENVVVTGAVKFIRGKMMVFVDSVKYAVSAVSVFGKTFIDAVVYGVAVKVWKTIKRLAVYGARSVVLVYTGVRTAFYGIRKLVVRALRTRKDVFFEDEKDK